MGGFGVIIEWTVISERGEIMKQALHIPGLSALRDSQATAWGGGTRWTPCIVDMGMGKMKEFDGRINWKHSSLGRETAEGKQALKNKPSGSEHAFVRKPFKAREITKLKGPKA